ncbi:3'-5' exonuclease, partial [Staphylococcus aureus]|nr:3'-5' exonuclease [Staphylococcus aureus]
RSKYIELREKGVDIYKFNGNQFYELITNYRKLRKN